jgi:23S rRNA (adenine2030-N6)-methyltransferase
LHVEFDVGAQTKNEALHACALAIVNPPWPLEDELKSILPALVRVLGNANEAKFRLDWLAR